MSCTARKQERDACTRSCVAWRGGSARNRGFLQRAKTCKNGNWARTPRAQFEHSSSTVNWRVAPVFGTGVTRRFCSQIRRVAPVRASAFSPLLSASRGAAHRKVVPLAVCGGLLSLWQCAVRAPLRDREHRLPKRGKNPAGRKPTARTPRAQSKHTLSASWGGKVVCKNPRLFGTKARR